MLKKRVVSLLLVCALLTSLLPVSVRAEGELVRIEGKDGAYALDPTSGGTYCLWIYEDPFINDGFDDILETIQPYLDKITTVCIGANVFYLSSSDNNPLAVCPNLTPMKSKPATRNFWPLTAFCSDATATVRYS